MPPGCSPQSLTSVLPPHSGVILFMHLLAYCLRSHMHTMYTLTHCTHHTHSIHTRCTHYIPHTHIIYTPYTLTHTLYTHHIPTHTRAGGSVRVGSSAHLMHWCSLHAESSPWTKWCRQGTGEWTNEGMNGWVSGGTPLQREGRGVCSPVRLGLTRAP